MADRDQMLKRQRVLADFGDFALPSQDLDAVLTEACRLVGEALGTDFSKVLELEPGGQYAPVQQGRRSPCHGSVACCMQNHVSPA